MKRAFFVALVIVLYAVAGAQTEKTRFTFFQTDNPYYKAVQKEYYQTLRHFHICYSFRGLPWRFFAFDLSDTTNTLVKVADTLRVVDNHIYYVVTPSLYQKVSILMIPKDGILYFFSGLNCCKPIHRISDALEWLSKQYDHLDEATLERVRNCLSYYKATPVDPQGSVPQCEWRCRKDGQSTGNNRYKKPKTRRITVGH